MSDTPTKSEDAKELGELSRALRARMDWMRDTGARGVDSGAEAPWEPAVELVSTGGELAPTAVQIGGDEHPSVPSAIQVGHVPTARPVAGHSLPPPPPPPRDAVQAGEALLRIETRVAECTACPLHATRTQTVFARGSGQSGLCFVGEGPGADEDEQGVPFVGKAGQLLDRMIQAMGFGRDEVYVCNIIKCRPPKNRKPEPSEILACSGYLREQLEFVQPQVIVALGATAVQGLLGSTVGITRLRGQWKLYRGRVAVMPTFHPAYLLRNPAAKREVWADLQSVLRHLGRPIPERG